MTGGNSSGFLEYKDKYFGFTMGIAEIARDGTFVVTKQPWISKVSAACQVPFLLTDT